MAIINIYEIQYVPYVHTPKMVEVRCEKIRKEECRGFCLQINNKNGEKVDKKLGRILSIVDLLKFRICDFIKILHPKIDESQKITLHFIS